MSQVIDISQYTSFIVTGRYYRSTKKFRSEYSNAHQAFGINLWNGSVWGILPNGKRKLLKRVYN